MGLIEHYKRIAESVKLPIIIYNVPARTGVNMLPQTVLKLSEIKNIAAIKEASGNMEQIMEIIRICPDDFALYSGDDSIVLPVLSVGGMGVISVVSNIAPSLMQDICNSFVDGNITESRERQYKLNPLIKTLFSEVNPIPVKAGLSLMGLCKNVLRLPLTTISKENFNQLKIELKTLNIL